MHGAVTIIPVESDIYTVSIIASFPGHSMGVRYQSHTAFVTSFLPFLPLPSFPVPLFPSPFPPFLLQFAKNTFAICYKFPPFSSLFPSPLPPSVCWVSRTWIKDCFCHFGLITPHQGTLLQHMRLVHVMCMWATILYQAYTGTTVVAQYNKHVRHWSILFSTFSSLWPNKRILKACLVVAEWYDERSLCLLFGRNEMVGSMSFLVSDLLGPNKVTGTSTWQQ